MTALFVSSHHPIPRQPGSRDDLGPFLNVVTWILLITSALAVVTRLITKRALKRRVDIDDVFVVLALVGKRAQYDRLLQTNNCRIDRQHWIRCIREHSSH
jgi:hypothetical protein